MQGQPLAMSQFTPTSQGSTSYLAPVAGGGDFRFGTAFTNRPTSSSSSSKFSTAKRRVREHQGRDAFVDEASNTLIKRYRNTAETLRRELATAQATVTAQQTAGTALQTQVSQMTEAGIALEKQVTQLTKAVATAEAAKKDAEDTVATLNARLANGATTVSQAEQKLTQLNKEADEFIAEIFASLPIMFPQYLTDLTAEDIMQLYNETSATSAEMWQTISGIANDVVANKLSTYANDNATVDVATKLVQALTSVGALVPTQGASASISVGAPLVFARPDQPTSNLTTPVALTHGPIPRLLQDLMIYMENKADYQKFLQGNAKYDLPKITSNAIGLGEFLLNDPTQRALAVRAIKLNPEYLTGLGLPPNADDTQILNSVHDMVNNHWRPSAVQEFIQTLQQKTTDEDKQDFFDEFIGDFNTLFEKPVLLLNQPSFRTTFENMIGSALPDNQKRIEYAQKVQNSPDSLPHIEEID